MVFNGKILLIGCGSVSQCALPLIIRHLPVKPSDITIMDFVDNREAVKEALGLGTQYVFQRLTRENYREVLQDYVQEGHMIIDLAWNIDCVAMLDWCRSQGVLYLNTSVEEWDPYQDEVRLDPTQYTLYKRQMDLLALMKKWGSNDGPTAVVDHGANPGLVSHFAKKALMDITQKILEEKPEDPRAEVLETALDQRAFNQLARFTGTKVLHISERDTQITNRPKQVNEFVNTWSIEGLFEEGVAPAELGWGTHERTLPENAVEHQEGPRNQICLRSIGMKTWVRSWVPSGEITGMVIRHGEAYSLSDRLTVWDGEQVVYRPTVHYAYCPSDVAINSLHELEMRQFKLQEEQRIMNDEIIDGADELGVLLMGHDFNAWWCGSLLNIHEARKQAPGQQATTLQVAIGVVSAALWIIHHPSRGLNLPDDLDHEAILDLCIPYISPFVSLPVDWNPLKNLNTQFTGLDREAPGLEDMWQFSSFLLEPGLRRGHVRR